MKEATGELSMVVITLIIIVAVLVIWRAVKDPVQEWVQQKFTDMEAETG